MSFGFPWLVLVLYVVVPVLIALLAYAVIRFGVHHGMRAALHDADQRRLCERIELDDLRDGDRPDS